MILDEEESHRCRLSGVHIAQKGAAGGRRCSKSIVNETRHNAPHLELTPVDLFPDQTQENSEFPQ